MKKTVAFAWVAVWAAILVAPAWTADLQVVASPKAPEAIGAYSQAIVVGDFVFVSGNLPINPATGQMPEAIADQAKQALDNIAVVLEEAGTSMKKVVKTTIFLADIADFGVVNETYSGYFTAPYPARSCIAVKDIPRGAKIEIEVIAVK
ncbi:MAG: Rid family detoxifying hydrolase [Planctomycetaceae bacterium]|nr:Rid family detoxifying hydrolase [Planctomycetaceae bacterium]